MKYYSEENNGQGQQKMITKGKLRGYVNWLNETKGGSFLHATASGSNKLVIKRMSDISGGTIHWTATRDTQSSQLTASTTSSSITITSNSSSRIPRGKFYLVGPDGTQYTELDNSNGGDNYSGFEDMTFIEADGKEDTYCLTYSDLSGETYARVFDEATMKDGIVIDGYSIGSGEQYKSFQLVAEKDVNFGKLTYDLVVSSITIEVDAMNDLEEYKRGVIPGSNDLAYATVYEKTNGSGTLFHNFDLNGVELTDNAETSGKTYTGVSITKGNSVATAPIVQSGSSSAYTLDVYFYADSGYTLSSKTISTKVGTSTTVPICASTHSFSSNSTAPAYSASSRVVNVSIASNGQVTFGIKQRKEIYGYFPVDVYRQGSSDFAIDENGNVALSAATKFVVGDNRTEASSYGGVKTISSGWVSNAGDNFGEGALQGGKIQLSSNDKSAYDDVMSGQGITDLTICGKDVYNSNGIVYDRGVTVGSDSSNTETYHMAYANEAYRLNTNKGGLKDTLHLFAYKGRIKQSVTAPDCTTSYFKYTHDPFISDYTYTTVYIRDYYKDVHSYGMTSILRRFRKISDSYEDTFGAYNASGKAPIVSHEVTIGGNSYPKHIVGKTIHWEVGYGWGSIDTIDVGDDSLEGNNWITIYEQSGTTEEFYGRGTYPTERNVVAEEKDNNWDFIVNCKSDNGSTEIYYHLIHPFFYTVDAESCDGISSGYTFKRDKSVIDMTNGVREEREYYLDDNHNFINGNMGDTYGNEQMCVKTMLTYINYGSSGETPSYNSTRYGGEYGDGYVEQSCTPSAPLQEVYWLDSYAPMRINYDSEILATSGFSGIDGLAFIDDDLNYVGSGSGTDGEPILEDFLVPSPYSWHGDGVCDLDDINEFTTSYNSFAGNIRYDSGNNTSSHGFKESVNYMSGCSYTNFEGLSEDNYLGYKIDTTNYAYTEPMMAVSAVTDGNGNSLFEKVNGKYHYSGNNIVYFNNNYSGPTLVRVNINTSPSSVRKFIPVIPRSPLTYKGGEPLRPCSGNITIPYWWTDIKFSARYFEEEEENEELAKNFGFKIYVNNNELKLTTENMITPSSSENYYYWLSPLNPDIFFATGDRVSAKGVYGSLSVDKHNTMNQYGEITEKYHEFTLRLLFVDLYNSNDFMINIVSDSDAINDGWLSWYVNSSYIESVGADILNQLSLKGWGEYKNNGIGDNELRCIGEGQNSVSYNMRTNKFSFNAITSNSTFSTKGVDVKTKKWY